MGKMGWEWHGRADTVLQGEEHSWEGSQGCLALGLGGGSAMKGAQRSMRGPGCPQCFKTLISSRCPVVSGTFPWGSPPLHHSGRAQAHNKMGPPPLSQGFLHSSLGSMVSQAPHGLLNLPQDRWRHPRPSLPHCIWQGWQPALSIPSVVLEPELESPLSHSPTV